MRIKLLNIRKALSTGQIENTQSILAIIVIITIKFSHLPKHLTRARKASRGRELVCMGATKPEAFLQSY